MSETKFYFRAAGIALHDDHILLHRAEDEDFWSLPGGGVEIGEFAPETHVREMREELDADVKVGALRFVVENMFVYREKQYHEICLYFEIAFAPDSPLLQKAAAHSGIERYFRATEFALIFEWVPLAELSSHDLRPTPLIELLMTPLDGIRHVLNRDPRAWPTQPLKP